MNFIYLGVAVWIATVSVVLAEEMPAESINLEERMKELSIPENQLPVAASEEQLYAVQTRYAPLSLVHEIGFSGARNFTPENFVVSHRLTGSYRFHLSDRWSVGTSGSFVLNRLSDKAQELIQKQRIYPDVVYTKQIFDLTAGLNLFYGKFRVTMERVLYFDLYAEAGPGIVFMNTSREPAAVGGLGFVFWMGKRVSFRMGMRDYFHKEVLRGGEGWVSDLYGHLDLGILLGGRG